MVLVEHREVLELSEAHHRKGVTFGSTAYKASTLTIDFVRWRDMGSPRQVVVTVTPGGIDDAEVQR